MSDVTTEETLRLLKAFHNISDQDARRTIIFVAEAAAVGAEIKHMPNHAKRHETKPN
jgi:hypothetical protein